METARFLDQDAASAGARSADEVAEARRLWEEQGVESPYFKRWFGESKVVDDEGQPLVVYKGTTRIVDEIYRPTGGLEVPRAVFFSDNADVAEPYRYPREYGEFLYERYDEASGEYVEVAPGSLIEAYISMKNPLVLVGEEAQNFTDDAGRQSRAVARAKSEGFDGIIAKNVVEDEEVGTTYVVFDPAQVKSVFNRGTFDPQDARILFQRDEAPKAATAAARAADDTLDTAAAKKASSMIGEQLTLKFDKSPDSTAKKAADTVVTPTADDDLAALAARGRTRAERLAVDIPEEDYATAAKKYQDLSEEKLLKMLDDRGISPSKVDFMSDRDRYIDALVISDFTPLEEKVRKAAPAELSYDEMSRDELRELISSRNEGRKKADRIKITGSLEALQKRIEADDAAQAIARGDVAPPDSFVPAKLPDKFTFGRADAARSKPIEVTARREIRISDPLMGEDIVLFEPVAVELIRITKDQPKEVPRKFSQLQKNYLSWRMKSEGESKEAAQEVLDRILSKKRPQEALVEEMDSERSASDVEEYIRLLKTSDDKPDFAYSHSLDNTKRFDSPDKALEDVNARLSIPENRAAQSIDQIIPYLDEADLGVIKRTLDAAGDTEGRLNINTMRKVAEGVSEDRLQDLYGMMSRVGLVKKTATARGVKELSPKAAEDLSKRLDEFFDPRVQAERILSATNVFNRIDELTLDALTAPDQAMDEDIAAFLQDLKKSSPEAYEELLEQKRSALTSELRDIRDTIVRHERVLRRLKAKTPKTSRSRALNEAAQLETERRIESLRVDFESLSEVLADPSDIPEIASDVALARSRAARDASGVADIPPAKPSVAGSVPPDAGMPKGMVYFFNDTAAILYAFRQADISTGLHEMAHVLRRQLDDDQLRSVTRWVNGQLQEDQMLPIRLTERNGRLDFDFPNNPESVVAAEELFARAFERYLREGETPNTLLQSAFATMRDVLKRIYSAITGKEIDVDISDEMYNLFDEVFGAQRQISLSDLSDGPQMYLDMQNDLARGGQRRLTARIAEQEQVEDTFVESYRQLSASLADYRARLFKIGKEVTAGPGRLKVDQGMQLGPVSRRLMTLEQIGEARKRGRVGRAYQAADALAVAGATVAEGIVYVTLLGGDANKIVRLAPPAIRAALTGHAREYEEFSSELSMRLIDISRMPPSQRTKGIRDLIEYVRGQEVQMKTGAQRGQRARANFVNAEDHFEKMVTSFYTKISDDSMELVADDVSRVLAGLGQKYGAMNGFWKGYAVKPVAGAVGKVDDVLSEGVFLSDDLDQLLKSVSGTDRKQQLTEMRTEMFDNLYAAVAGVDNYVSGNPEATRLAAEMAFLSGVTPVTINGKKFTIADLDTERSFFDYLFFGGTVRNSEGAEMVLKGLANITAQTPDRTVGAFAIAAQTGYLSGIYSDLRKVGLGLTASDARVFAQYLSGEGALLSTEDLAKAKELFRRFGRTKFEISPEALGNFYIPQQTRKLLMEQQKQALRQMGLSKKTAGLSWNPLSWMLSFYQSMIIFGGVFQRQSFKFMSTIDLGLQVGMTVGGREGAAAAARASALTLLSAIGGERIAEGSELTVRAAYAIAGKTMPPEMFKTKLRELAIKKGDEAVNTVTELMGMSKFRVEVNPIIENRDKLYAIGGRVYNARDLRRTFTQAGMYSNAFKEMRQNWWRDLPQKEAEKEPLSDANRKFFDSVKESTGEFFDDPGRTSWAAARRSASTVFEHGVESADAWSDLERTGAAVTLMEFGYSPRDAAKIVVEAVYDYRGSMSNYDRHWIRRLLMPFWAFRKNANTQAINMLATPQGVMRVTALRRAMEFGPEALTYVMYESLLQPYDVDVSLMNPRVRDVYYETRTIIEMGYGDEPSEEVLAEYRAQLPDEAVNISDEDLLDYSFDGWTIRSGFKGYSNVPERFRVSFRALLSGNTSSMVRQRGGVYRLSDAIAQQSVSDFYVQEGAEMSARAERGETGLPAWAAKRPAIQVPLPTLNESAREVIKFLKNTGMTSNDVPDPGDSLYFVLPDNFVMSAVDHAGAMLATTAVIGQLAKKGLDEDVDITKADTTRLLNSLQPLVDVRQSGSAQLELIEKIVSQAKAVGGGVSPRQRLHPITARLLEGSLGIPLPYEGGKPKNSPGSAFFFEVSGSETVETLAKVAGGTLGDIDTRGDVPGRFSRMYSRPVEVVARDSEGRTREDPDFDITTAKREVSVAQPFFSGTAFDYTVPNTGKEGEERLAYTPYLYGASAITFPLTFLGQFNKWLLTNVGDGPIETSMLQNGDVENEILNLAAEFYKLVGGRVTEADYGKIASMERIRE